MSGRPFSATLPDYEPVYPVVQVGVAMPRPELDQRIADRVGRMWQLGLVDEVRRLEQAGLREGRTASRALGYAQVLKYLAGECTEEAAAAQTILATRRFVRRQESWFRRDPRVSWLPAGPDLADRALAVIADVADCIRPVASIVAMRFAKGHGTGNDFVILPDYDGELELSAELVARICDRHFGIGADGVLRVVRTAAVPAEAAGQAAEWFMDYRNADGSVAEMCGNGVRVFAKYLIEQGKVDGPELAVATRAGTRTVRVEADGQFTVNMGGAAVLGAGEAEAGDQRVAGLAISVGNPHLACMISQPVAAFDLTAPRVLAPAELTARRQCRGGARNRRARDRDARARARIGPDAVLRHGGRGRSGCRCRVGGGVAARGGGVPARGGPALDRACPWRHANRVTERHGKPADRPGGNRRVW